MKIISVAQQKGGSGKSTIAAHLAVTFYQRGKKVCLIDTDPQASLSKWYRIRADKMGENYAGIHFESTSGWKVSSVVSRLKNVYDIIIIDSPPHSDESKNVIRIADLVLLPMQISPTDLWAIQKTIDFAKFEDKKIKILLNRCNKTSKLFKEIVSQIKDLELLCTASLGNRVAFASAMIHGKTITEIDPKSDAALEIKSVVEEINEVLYCNNTV